MKKFLSLGLISVAALCLFGWLAMQSYMTGPVEELANPLVFEVQEGASLHRVATDLKDIEILRWPRLFTLWGRLKGKAHRVQAGEYLLEPGMSPANILDQFVEGRVKLYAFTILEGWTYKEILVALASNGAIAATLEPTDADVSGILGALDSVGMDGIDHPEGLLFPETYFVPKNSTDAEVLKQAAELMQVRLAAAWADRAEGLPLKNPYELLTLASIVERETAVDSERARVAGVFMRRLQKPMRLQTDPTVIYGLGDAYDGNLTRRHLLTDNPYNTYTRGGLPPTPIGMPGAASLHAAGHPDDGDALYFVASGVGDGTHVFSATLEEHNAAVAAYISQLRKANRARRENAGADQ
jgi:UPF0755 protein